MQERTYVVCLGEYSCWTSCTVVATNNINTNSSAWPQKKLCGELDNQQ